jgi:membrane protease YdiL (CAAX protease family)
VRTLRLLALVALLLAVTALISPAVHEGLAAQGWSFKFGRVYNRVLEVLLVAGFLARWRRLDLGSARDLGLRRRTWARELGRGLALGLGGLAIGLFAAWLGGGLLPALRFDAAKTLRKALTGMAGAAVVGGFEEILFRGVLLRRLTRDAGLVAGLALATGIFAVVHGLRFGGGELHGPAAGIQRTLDLFSPLATPQAWPGVAGLAGLGAVLAAARLLTGSLWVPIGIHVAWVAVFRVGRLFLDLRADPAWLMGPGWPPLVGGLAGWIAIGTTAGLLTRRSGRGRAR